MCVFVYVPGDSEAAAGHEEEEAGDAGETDRVAEGERDSHTCTQG